MRLVQVHFLATLRAPLRDFYYKYEDDARGYGHLWLELRAWVCGAPGAEVVTGSDGERRSRDCDFVLCRAGAVRGPRERFGHYV